MNEIKFKDYGYEGLIVFRNSFLLAMEIYIISKQFPKSEQYALTDQLRRSSRSICANIAEGYRKRVYPKSFSAKIVDADGECSETIVHLKFARACGYIIEEKFTYFENKYDEIGKMLNAMYQNPGKFTPLHSESQSM